MLKPYKHMPLDEAISYCHEQGISAADANARETGRLDKLAKFTGIPLHQLLAAVAKDNFSFEGLHPNPVRGPLSEHNKTVIHSTYADVSLCVPLSRYLNTSYQNVRNAQRGNFVVKQPRKNKVSHTRVLTLEEKIEIHENHACDDTTVIAERYKTRYQYAREAQLGNFKRDRVQWVTHHITREQAEYLGIESTTIKVKA